MGNARLKSHWENGAAVEALREGGWDFVVLQEQSTLGVLVVDGRHEINEPERILYPYARKFHAEARQRGTRTLLALTWSRRRAPEAQARLSHAFLTLGRELDATVSPIGLAWQAVRDQHPDVPLYLDDGSHPTPAGTYLAACTLYATLFGRSPEGLATSARGIPIPNGQPQGAETTLVSLPEPTARLLQKAAWQAVETLKTRDSALDTPAPRPLPSLPTGASVKWDALAGTWAGELRFYPEEWGQSPARMRLELKRTDEQYQGQLRISFADGTSEGPHAVQLERSPEGTMRFTAPFGANAPGDVRFEAATDRNGQLVGTAAHEDPRTLDRILGSWSLAPVR
ncbi:SGNH/GDSL hydrolase family protein [Pyxidicoccus xibeiensis]|uniref:SGNH/GDSL hydrolase family protein n=1 Tax=Pyxidicoccus xibeiensis TaxID=2906759 RepID=UPI0020A71A96|nr:SGNH/GDSL hydrolase family protein [Pyxidicoccus xibeiensis]MCP3141742.1 SGNH/GDSL hydrolase family protein [Pyxidicoccus xibeiensis]